MAVTQSFEWARNVIAANGMGNTQLPVPRRQSAPGIARSKSTSPRTAPQTAGEEWVIVQRAIAGDSEALASLFARDRMRLYRAAYSVLRNKEDAEDALQSGLCSAYVNIRSFQGRSRFSTWVTRIVLNAALMYRRKRQTLAQLSLEEVVARNPHHVIAPLVDARPNPEQVYALAEAKDVVTQEMGRLSPLLRTTFQLRFIGNLTTAETAKEECTNILTTKSRSARARRQVAELAAARGVSL
jgi:RNA polymerase sigma-70 factor (ECF subfamily)